MVSVVCTSEALVGAVGREDVERSHDLRQTGPPGPPPDKLADLGSVLDPPVVRKDPTDGNCLRLDVPVSVGWGSSSILNRCPSSLFWAVYLQRDVGVQLGGHFFCPRQELLGVRVYVVVEDCPLRNLIVLSR